MSLEDKTNIDLDIPKEHLLETLHLISESSQEEKYISKISNKTKVSSTAISNRADELENKGLIRQINKGNSNSKTFLELTEKGKQLHRKSASFISNYDLEDEIKEFESLFMRKPTRKELEKRLGNKISEEELLNLENYNSPSQEAIDKADQLVKYLLMEKIYKKISDMEKSKNKDYRIMSQERKETREKFEEHNLKNEINRLDNLGDKKDIDLSLEDFDLEENSVTHVEETDYDVDYIDTKIKSKLVCVEIPEPWKSYFSSKEGIEDFYYMITYKDNLNNLTEEIRNHKVFRTNLKLFLDRYLPWREQKPRRVI